MGLSNPAGHYSSVNGNYTFFLASLENVRARNATRNLARSGIEISLSVSSYRHCSLCPMSSSWNNLFTSFV
jgi:hypothetical protein